MNSTETPDPHAGQLQAALAARSKLETLLQPNAFADDDGTIRPAVNAALEQYLQARALGQLEGRAAMVDLIQALADTRLIVPVAAHAKPAVLPGQPGHSEHTNDAAQDAATLAVDLPDGHIALPVFTSAQAMSVWREGLRPVPVSPQRAAQVACLDTDQLWVLDPGTHDVRLPRPAVVSLAVGENWVPSWENPVLQEDLRAELTAIPGVLKAAFEAGDDAELRVYTLVDRSQGKEKLIDAIDGCQRVLVNPAWGERIDTVELCPVMWPLEEPVQSAGE